ncbi:prolyl-tRNA synthetase [Patescibacteria group bacterium]|nr:prolyl-tRNA synthetase [Patescibacteria group bacterium]
MAGVYSLLPLGLRVINKIADIIREEMNAIGGQEVFLTTLQNPKVWEKSGRWQDEAMNIWFKTKLSAGGELGLANTHEEPLTMLMKNHISSTKDLPKYIYQIQTKFRNEKRAKSGIMRTREFMMKDLYSFNRNEEEFKVFYEECARAYLRIFNRVGLGDVTYRTLASGGTFTTGLTDEFQTLSEAGEDTIYVSKDTKQAINKEVYNKENIKKLNLDKSKLVEKKSIEVGNIFPLGTKYPETLGLYYKDEEGNKNPVYMGSYGIGLGRVMGTVVEVLSDDKGIVWPENISPFKIHLVLIDDKDGNVKEYADEIYQSLIDQKIDVLYDDRNVRPGEKFADSDLIGIPTRAVISERTMGEGKIEITNRRDGKTRMIGETEIYNV